MNYTQKIFNHMMILWKYMAVGPLNSLIRNSPYNESIMYVTIIKLKNMKYYMGSTNNITLRIKHHIIMNFNPVTRHPQWYLYDFI